MNVYGIDLGVSFSAIARLKGEQVEIFKNNEGFEYTPSAVWIDKKNRLYTGYRAMEMLAADPGNAFTDIRFQMGTGAQYIFTSSGRRMSPEQVSAEILKSLKANVRHHAGEEVTAAVITIPADAGQPQIRATWEAAQLAGINHSHLIQEPIAVGLACGLHNERNKSSALVYNLSNGMFNVSVIQNQGGIIRLIHHTYENYLGGNQIDWKVVDSLLIPSVTRAYHLRDFRRGNPKWALAIAKLKWAAEDARIRLWNLGTTRIVLDHLCLDDWGKPVKYEYELSRGEIEYLAEPIINRSINICKRLVERARLGGNHIGRVLLVGGPTLMPYLWERLADRNEGLDIPLDFSVDPFMAFVKGAATSAGMWQRSLDERSLPKTQPRRPAPERPISRSIREEKRPDGAITLVDIEPGQELEKPIERLHREEKRPDEIATPIGKKPRRPSEKLDKPKVREEAPLEEAPYLVVEEQTPEPEASKRDKPFEDAPAPLEKELEIEGDKPEELALPEEKSAEEVLPAMVEEPISEHALPQAELEHSAEYPSEIQAPDTKEPKPDLAIPAEVETEAEPKPKAPEEKVAEEIPALSEGEPVQKPKEAKVDEDRQEKRDEEVALPETGEPTPQPEAIIEEERPEEKPPVESPKSPSKKSKEVPHKAKPKLVVRRKKVAQKERPSEDVPLTEGKQVQPVLQPDLVQSTGPEAVETDTAFKKMGIVYDAETRLFLEGLEELYG